MKKQKKTFIVLVCVLVIALLGYVALIKYNESVAEKEAEEEEAAKIYVTEADASDIISFSYQVDGETLTFSLIDDSWICAEYPEYDLDEDKVSAIASDFDHMEATTVIDDYEDLSDYGFDSPTEIMTLTTSDENTVILTVGMKNDITGEYYMTSDADENLYLVDSTVATGFETSIDDLIAEEEETETETEDTETMETESAETESTETESEE
ncbi:MAG: DUF4340 domain-containing protein [Lachnospiraceae bacterium]|nr:DUF4340 domain-containing protein [Lachnospiraceae bacterium]